jgi:hypothetical protein
VFYEWHLEDHEVTQLLGQLSALITRPLVVERRATRHLATQDMAPLGSCAPGDVHFGR